MTKKRWTAALIVLVCSVSFLFAAQQAEKKDRTRIKLDGKKILRLDEGNLFDIQELTARLEEKLQGLSQLAELEALNSLDGLEGLESLEALEALNSLEALSCLEDFEFDLDKQLDG